MKKIMILGTFHMVSEEDIEKVSDKERLENMDEEFEKLIAAISGYAPNKVFVEYERDFQERLDKAFENFKKNGGRSMNEVVKIAFPVAQRCDSKVLAVDWMEQGAAIRPCSDVIDALDTEPELKTLVDSFRTPVTDLSKGLLENFRILNSKKEVERSKAFYVNLARLGVKDYYGMGWLIWWYQRNLNIFANIASNLKDGDRALLLIGAAHKGILEEMLKDSKDFEIESTEGYLK